MKADIDQLFWVEKYRPHKISDCILPDELKKTFQDFVDRKEIINMILAGGPGMGKTTVARALCEELDMDHIVINGSLDRGIDSLRTTVLGFATTVSLTGGRKVIIVDEGDNLTSDAQKAFRGVIEEVAENCSFIYTCNYSNRLIPALHSRTAVINFKIAKETKPKMAQTFCKRVEEILAAEGVEYDRKVVIALVMKHFPDFRRTLNELQRFAVSRKIDSTVLSVVSESRATEAIEYLKQKDFGKLRKWVGENIDNDTIKIMRELYDNIYSIVQDQYIPIAVVKIGEYMRWDGFVADKEVNLMALLSEMILEFDFKS